MAVSEDCESEPLAAAVVAEKGNGGHVAGGDAWSMAPHGAPWRGKTQRLFRVAAGMPAA